jgi:hypothetical protein
MTYDTLQTFRAEAYQHLSRAHDATFELLDAVMTTRHVYSFAELSQSPLFRRCWPSLYETVKDSRPHRQKLMRLYIQQITSPACQQMVLAGDHTPWSRPDAKRLPERTYEHQANGEGLGSAVTVGQGYSTLAWIPEASGSWALPLRHERITSWESPITKAVWQLKQVCRDLSTRPLSLWDSEYGCASFVLKSAEIEADKLMRLRSNRNLWSAPPPYGGHGRPRVHGDKFKLNDVTTWWSADEEIEVQHPQLGRVRVRCWRTLHFRQAAAHPLNLIQVQRLDEAGNPKSTRPLWLAWVGQTMPPLNQLWQCYLRRFALEHWYRFLKQRLHWTVPEFGSTQAAERWSDLMPLVSWQLWLARKLVQDSPLPWQKPMRTISPGRVADSIAPLLAQLGSPAKPPKTRGKSPGWPKGKARKRKPLCPIVRKSYKRKKKEPDKDAS